MNTETAPEGRGQEGSGILEMLDKLMLDLQRLNQGNRRQKSATAQLNQETRALLKQIREELLAA